MFKIESKHKPTGDQPKAINALTKGINSGKSDQVLKGVTGSGKTFTIANVVANTNKSVLVIAHNKTLAGQLYSEFKELFPNNLVNYYVSYYDYYQPEAYVAHSDTYIAKDASINQEIEKLRHSATSSLFESDQVIVVASVSCIYGLGDPIDYANMTVSLRTGKEVSRDEVMEKLIRMQYSRNEIDFKRGTFRAKGDVLDIFPSNSESVSIRVDFFGDEVEAIYEVNSVTGKKLATLEHAIIYPNSHYVTNSDKIDKAIERIESELEDQIKYFESNNMLLESQRIKERTNFDLEMLRETGFCQGIENYSRHISGREEGEPPYTLFDYFPDDFVVVVDESHATIPQIRAMYNGDRARKENLVRHGFRLPSALDNRPLKFNEFEKRAKKTIYVSATPGDYELEKVNGEVVEQIIRPTGLIDPKLEVKPLENQVDDLLNEINIRTKDKELRERERVLVTTLTKKQAEDLSKYLKDLGIKAEYIHSDIKALERLEIIRRLRLGEFDVLIGINLLREGLDIPEVSLVAILDADKEGFLRSERALIQTIGRAARNSKGKVILYADEVTDSMHAAITETNRRRTLQEEYNKKHGITPTTISKSIREVVRISTLYEEAEEYNGLKDADDVNKLIEDYSDRMVIAAKDLDFETAAELRDKIKELEKLLKNM